MAKLFTSKRMRLPRGAQRELIQKAKEKNKLSNKELSRIVGVTIRTLTDWEREKFLLPLPVARKMAKLAGVILPKNMEILDRFWYVKKAAQQGGKALCKKYGNVGGDPKYRKEKWREWWEKNKKITTNPILHARTINIPNISEKLAEFTGIILGDGGITKYQVTITLHNKDDKEYTKFVTALIKNLFKVTPKIYKHKKYSAHNIVVSRKELVAFCTERLGLKIGNKIKQKIDIPLWILKNKKLRIACIRGLIDTDGSIFDHTYKVNNKTYRYKKLAFTSASKPLVTSVFSILKKDVEVSPRISRERDVWLDRVSDVEKYISRVGSHNPKHLRRYKA